MGKELTRIAPFQFFDVSFFLFFVLNFAMSKERKEPNKLTQPSYVLKKSNFIVEKDTAYFVNDKELLC